MILTHYVMVSWPKFFFFGLFFFKIINVYDQKYESGAAFWPDVHLRILIGLIIAQILHMGLLSATGADKSTTPWLIAQPILTIWFHKFCKGRFESAFVKFPLQVSAFTFKYDCLQKLCYNGPSCIEHLSSIFMIIVKS